MAPFTLKEWSARIPHEARHHGRSYANRPGAQLAAAGSKEAPLDIPVEVFIRVGRHETVETLREYAARRLSFALRRFPSRIRRVTLRLTDVNGPRRGVDSRCSIAADLADGRQLFVDATAAWPFAAITAAAGRLNEAVRRQLGRDSAHRPPRTESFEPGA